MSLPLSCLFFIGCKPVTTQPQPPQIIKVPVPIKSTPIYLPPKEPLPLSQLTPNTTLKAREQILLATIKALMARADSLEDLIKAHNKSVDQP